MDTKALAVKQLAPLFESKPTVAICLSGQKELYQALKKEGVSAFLKPLNFDYESWASGLVSETKIPEEHVDISMGIPLIKNPARLKARSIEEDEVDVFLAMFLNQHKDKFAVNKNNYFVIFQDTVHTGRSLEAMRNALIMNGIPKNKIVTAAFHTSISPIFPPDVHGGKVILKPKKQQKNRHWIKVSHRGKDFALNVPLP